jgi:hypothetical protein
MDAIPWRSSRLPEAAAALVIVSSVALRWLVRFALRRRRGVVVNRHAYHPVDLLRSVVFSVSQTQGGNWVLISGFVVAFVFRRILRRGVDVVTGRRPAPHGVAKVARLLAISMSRHVLVWLAGGACLWFAHWRVRVCERPVVSCKRTFWNVAIVEKAGFARREFKPVFWLTSRHAQTVLAHVLADLSFLLLRPVRWRRERVAGQEKRAKFPTSKAPISAVFHSFRLIFGRAIISRNGLEAWMLFPERARAEHSC